MAKWLVAVDSNCSDPEREEEFNEWYNEVHLPDQEPVRAKVERAFLIEYG